MTVVEWLLDSDPAIRWQVLRDLVQAPPDVVDSERRVAKEGWGARMLALQGNDGLWAGGACFPARNLIHADRDTGQPWISTLPTLQLLCDFGVDPRTDRVRQAVALVKENCRWEHAGQPFFSGEVEPCINGRTVKLGVYFDQDVEGIVTPRAARPNPSRPAPWRGIPPRTKGLSAQEQRRNRQSRLAAVLVSDLVALRRAACAGLLPRRGRRSRFADG